MPGDPMLMESHREDCGVHERNRPPGAPISCSCDCEAAGGPPAPLDPRMLEPPWSSFRDGMMVPIGGWWFRVRGVVLDERALVLEAVAPCGTVRRRRGRVREGVAAAT